MWLLKLHFSISVLCLLTFIGFKIVFKQSFIDNGWFDESEQRKKKILCNLIFFVPIMNVLLVIVLFVMISMKKKDFDKMCEDAKKNSEVSDYD